MKLKVDAAQTEGGRGVMMKKCRGEGMSDIHYWEGEGDQCQGVGSVPPAVSIFVSRRRKNKQLLSVSICFALFTPVPHVKRLHGFAVLTSSVDEMSEPRLRGFSINAGCN